jgi:excisionase family DNA binding protein
VLARDGPFLFSFLLLEQMTITQLRRWLLAQLEQIEPKIGNRTPVARFAEIVADAKRNAYAAGLHDLALTLPDTETVKTPLAAANQLRRALFALDSTTADSDWLTYKQVKRLLGLSVQTIRRRVYDGVLPPPVKLGRSARFRRLDIENFRGRYA